MPDQDHPPVNSLTYSSDLNVFRSKTELFDVIANLKDNLAWYVEQRNRLTAENNSLRAQIGLERIKTRNAMCPASIAQSPAAPEGREPDATTVKKLADELQNAIGDGGSLAQEYRTLLEYLSRAYSAGKASGDAPKMPGYTFEEERAYLKGYSAGAEASDLQLSDERHSAEDALQKTHIALGGDGEWVTKLPPEFPPTSGDLRLDVPILAASAAEREKLCPLCEHEWKRHDPEDGKCDAGPPCLCGRDIAWIQEHIAALSRAALSEVSAEQGPKT